MVRPHFCILCESVTKDLDHILCCCDFVFNGQAHIWIKGISEISLVRDLKTSERHSLSLILDNWRQSSQIGKRKFLAVLPDLECHKGTWPSSCLGLPLDGKPRRLPLLAPIIERITNTLQKWKSKYAFLPEGNTFEGHAREYRTFG